MLNLKSKIWSGYAIAFLLLLASYFIIFYSSRRMRQATGEISLNHETTGTINGLSLSAIAAKNTVLDYYYSGDTAKLAFYHEQAGRVADFIVLMENELFLHPQPALDSLKRVAQELLVSMKEGVAQFQQTPFTHTNRHDEKGNELRSIFSRLLTHSTMLINSNEARISSRIISLNQLLNTTQIITLISLILAGALIFYSLITFNKENRAKGLARQKVQEYSLELEKKIKQLEETNREINTLRSMEKFASTGRIARTIAHEVRNPLTNISLAVEQLRELGVQHEEYQLLLDMVSRNAVRINQLSNNLLNATKFEELNVRRHSINQLLDETLEMAKDRIDLQHITVQKQYAQDICAVSVDSAKMKIALLNIIVNAIESMEKDKGILSLKTSSKDDRCVIEVEDNGPGMDEELVHKVFEPFFTSKQKGTGLGLTNSQNIILNHKGTISIDSKPGCGTRFIITLDFAKDS